MSFTVRQAARGDLGEVHRIEQVSYSDPWPRSLFFLVMVRSSGLFLVAEAEGRIVGYAVGELEEQEGDVSGHVLNLAVAEGWKRRGVGGRLLAELEGLFRQREASTVFLEVRVGNSAAQSLYAKREYRNVGLLRGYYRTEDGFRMEKPLKR